MSETPQLPAEQVQRILMQLLAYSPGRRRAPRGHVADRRTCAKEGGPNQLLGEGTVLYSPARLIPSSAAWP